MENVKKRQEIATFAGGCFWCTEAIFENIKGVSKVVSGYSGGKTESPNYEEVSNGNTGHAETIQISFDPNMVSYKDLLYIFWRVHDPTTLNRQGADVGTQYRSVIFYHNEKQKKDALESKQEFEREKVYSKPILTEIVPFENFYAAEEYHQKYYLNNSSKPYCSIVINPKLQKLQLEFGKFLKS